MITILLAVVIHEVCHVLAAILVKKKPKILSIGFWKPCLSFTYKDIQFKITPFILGGYVSFHKNLMKSKEELKKISHLRQSVIYAGGCIGNLLTGILALGILYSLVFFEIYHMSIITFLLYFGGISIVLAISNLIPFPPMDGWQLVQCGIEKIRGKDFSTKTNLVLTYSGLGILSLVSLYSIYFLILMI